MPILKGDRKGKPCRDLSSADPRIRRSPLALAISMLQKSDLRAPVEGSSGFQGIEKGAATEAFISDVIMKVSLLVGKGGVAENTCLDGSFSISIADGSCASASLAACLLRGVLTTTASA